ncbi:hypothetical protein [Streptomyces sp. NPDC002540]
MFAYAKAEGVVLRLNATEVLHAVRGVGDGRAGAKEALCDADGEIADAETGRKPTRARRNLAGPSGMRDNG